MVKIYCKNQGLLHYQSSFENYVFNDSQRLIIYHLINDIYMYDLLQIFILFYPSISKPPHFYKAISH